MAASSPARRVYLDVCALSRPFDDQTQARIRLETEAVKLILSHVRRSDIQLIASTAHAIEIAAIDNMEERSTLEQILAEFGHRPSINMRAARQRAEALTSIKLGPADAAHLALAEQAQADFVSTDDQLLKRAQRARLSIWIGTPVAYCEKEHLR